mmetsp:Transcript_9286/g.15244  ORF Transcript_9286/g.15244 Transcript_9286/m.15244 type:complete len:87 (+) Transcript_9286:430-690(+)
MSMCTASQGLDYCREMCGFRRFRRPVGCRSLRLAQAAITRTFAEAAPMSFAVADLYSVVAASSSWNLAGWPSSSRRCKLGQRLTLT